MIEKSKRRLRFEEVAGRRVQSIIEKLDSLSNCSNRRNYEYSEEDVRKMFIAIKEKLRSVEIKYIDELNRMNKKKFKF